MQFTGISQGTEHGGKMDLERRKGNRGELGDLPKITELVSLNPTVRKMHPGIPDPYHWRERKQFHGDEKTQHRLEGRGRVSGL